MHVEPRKCVAKGICEHMVAKALLPTSDVKLVLDFAHGRRCVTLTTVAARLRM